MSSFAQPALDNKRVLLLLLFYTTTTNSFSFSFRLYCIYVNPGKRVSCTASGDSSIISSFNLMQFVLLVFIIIIILFYLFIIWHQTLFFSFTSGPTVVNCYFSASVIYAYGVHVRACFSLLSPSRKKKEKIIIIEIVPQMVA